ncbi:MAG: hypothetical protein WEB55_05865 [Acidimicrobiia bacterium]
MTSVGGNESLQSAAPAGLGFGPGDRFDLELPSTEDGAPRRVSEWHGRPLMLHLFASW